MKLSHLLIILLGLTPPLVLVIYKGPELTGFFRGSPETNKQQQSTRQYQQQLEEGFAEYQKAYQQEQQIYQRDIIRQWGEFKDSSAKVWVSYEARESVRRSVDFENGSVEVDVLFNKGGNVNTAREKLGKAVYRLMNSSEKEAYQSDQVANRVEQRLSRFESVLSKSELGDRKIFSMQDLLSLRISHNGFFKVSSEAANLASSEVITSAKQDKQILRVSFSIPHSIHQKAARYSDAVEKAAKKENINDELIYAIMETESSFNPMAKSHIPAYGLMQIVPRTAGKDATRYLYGEARLLAPSFLYKPENNISIGAAYLHVLVYKYMRKVINKESRMYCAIAAYNTGASNVAKAFIDRASFNRATPVINSLTPDEVFEKLKNYLPQRETRNYIIKVSERMEKYL